MNFLIVNDDGIAADGIKALAEALSAHGEIFVCAPNKQQSGKGQSITFLDPIYVMEADFPAAKMAWMVEGTPADCTKVGLQLCKEMGSKIDIVFSGINQGSNLGSDTLYSGTVGAAMEGVLQGYRAIAVSVGSHAAKHFDVACDLAIQCIPKIMSIEPSIVLNINTPDEPRENIKGVKCTALGPAFFLDGFVQKDEEEYQLEGHVPDHSHLGEVIDSGANSMGYATISPLKPDHTDHEFLKTMDDWGLTI